MIIIEDSTSKSNEIRESLSSVTQSHQRKYINETIGPTEEDDFVSLASFNKDNPSLFEINVEGSCLSTISSLTVSPSLKCIRLASSFLEGFEGTDDKNEETMNMMKAMQEIEQRQKEIKERQKIEEMQK